MKYIVSLGGPEKNFLKNLYRKYSKICKDPGRSAELSLRSSGTIFIDPQGKLAHRSVQILKESSTWDLETSLRKKDIVVTFFGKTQVF